MGHVYGRVTTKHGTQAGLYTLLVSTRTGRRTWTRVIGMDTPALVEMR